MPYVTSRDGTSLYVKIWGEGPPVVLLHGWSLSSDFWDGQAVALADAGYRVIAPDRRGFGRSEQPSGGYDYDTFSDDLADVLEATGATEGVTLVGYSMGSGEVARYLSRHRAGGVTRAALVSPVAPLLLKREDNPHGYSPTEFEAQTAKLREDRPNFFRTYAKQLYGQGVVSHPVSQAVLDWTWGMEMQAGLRSLLLAREAFGRTDFRGDMASFTMPTLIVHGDKDSDAPIDATARAAAAAIPQARLIEYAGAYHGLPITHGARLTDDLLVFLRG